ncbi:hypothetical protein EON65_56935 [archaeon]|nr:MAG: hypothetical protein EON65_56935 [archaeon]
MSKILESSKPSTLGKIKVIGFYSAEFWEWQDDDDDHDGVAKILAYGRLMSDVRRLKVGHSTGKFAKKHPTIEKNAGVPVR